MEENIQELLESYIKQSNIIEECSYNGDFKRNNKAVDSIMLIERNILKDNNHAKFFIDQLIQRNEISVLINICVFAIRINYRKEEAENIIYDISKREDILGFIAGMIYKLKIKNR